MLATDLAGSSSRLSDCGSSRLAGWTGTTSSTSNAAKGFAVYVGVGGEYEVELTTLRGCCQPAAASSGESCVLPLSVGLARSQPSVSLAVAGFTRFPSQYEGSSSGDVLLYHISSRDPSVYSLPKMIPEAVIYSRESLGSMALRSFPQPTDGRPSKLQKKVSPT